MQEKKPHIDQEFADHAWSAMKDLLDKELPVVAPEKRRRPFAWWWLLVGLGLGLGAWWFLRQHETPISEPSEIPAIAEHTEQSSKSIADAITEPIADKEMVPTEWASVPERDKSKRRIQQKSIPGIAGASQSAVSQTGNSDPGMFTSQENLRPISEEKMAEKPVVKKNLLSELSKLPQIGLSKLSVPNTAEISFHTEPIKAKKPLGVNLYAGAMSNPIQNVEGISTGVLLHFPKEASRIQFEVGLGYSYIRQPLSILIPAIAGTIGPVTPSTIGSVILSFNDLNSQANMLNRNYLLAHQDLGLHYLELPVALSFKLNKRLRLHTGLSTVVLLVSAPDFTRGGLFSSNSGRFQLDANSVEKNQSAEAEFYVPISRFDVSATAGIRYKVSPRLGVEVSYRAGLLDLIDSNTENDFVRLMRLSLHYRLR